MKKQTISAEDVGIPSNKEKLANKPSPDQTAIEWKVCPATTTYNHVRVQCIKLAGHPGSHSAWAKIHWDKGQRPYADIDLHMHLADCKCHMCTDPVMSKVKQIELARRGRA